MFEILKNIFIKKNNLVWIEKFLKYFYINI
jgi:hypothetical protein